MATGGYHIIDLRGVVLTEDPPTTVTGIYESIEGSYQKALLLSGLNVDGIEYPDAFVAPTLSGTTYTITVYEFTISITDADEVTVAA